MALGSAKFGSGLLSVTLCMASTKGIGVRVIVGRCATDNYNTYYQTSLTDGDMTLDNLDASGNCTVNVTSATAGFNETSDSFDPDNDEFVRASGNDWQGHKGDGTRYFWIPTTTALSDIVVSTTAVSGNTGGRLQTMTLTASPLGDNLKLGMVGCVKQSVLTGVANPITATQAAVPANWDFGGLANANYQFNAYTTWDGDVDASGNTITLDDATGLTNGDPIFISGLDAAQDVLGYVGSLSVNTFQLEDALGNVLDLTESYGNAITAIDPRHGPIYGMWGLHVSQMLDAGINCFLGIEDNYYFRNQGRDFERWVPVPNSSATRGQPIGKPEEERYTEVVTNHTWNRGTVTDVNNILPQNAARSYFCSYAILEMGQQIPLAFGRGDHDFHMHNNEDHSGVPHNQSTEEIGGTALAAYSSSATYNPLADANYAARVGNLIDYHAVMNDVWDLYFQAGNPPSYLNVPDYEDWPVALKIDSSGSAQDPLTVYSGSNIAQNRYYCRGFAIESNRQCVLVPDYKTWCGGSINSTLFPDNQYVNNDTTFHVNHVFGGETVWGSYQKSQLLNKASSAMVEGKVVGLASKGIMYGTPNSGNHDAPKACAVQDVADFKTHMNLLQDTTLIAAADKHVTPAQRSTEGRAVA